MTKIAKKITEREKVNFSGKNIYIGLDVHKKNWYASVYVEQQFVKTFHQESTGTILLKFLQTNYPNGQYKACYEAGFCGFSVYRELTSLGIECVIANPADIPQTNKGQLSKTDASDSRRIGEAFSKQFIKPIYIPDKVTESDRSLIRYRKKTQIALKAKKQNIKSCLNTLGIKIPIQYDKPYWTNNFINWLKGLDINETSSKITIEFIIEDILLLRKRLLSINKKIRDLSKTSIYYDNYLILTSAPGVGLITAMTLLTEVGNIKRFDNFNKFNSFIGLCPLEFSSGEKQKKGPMTTRSNKTIRSLIIEASWIAIRQDPALTLKYQELIKTKTNKRAIVIIARKLLSRIYTIWKTGQMYERAIVK